MECFNASDAARTVTGLMRSLGLPRASVGAAAGYPGRMRVTVAWELCWYQWAVDLSGDVVELGKGQEVGELDPAARHWNVSVSEEAKLTFGAARPRRRGWLGRR